VAGDGLERESRTGPDPDTAADDRAGDDRRAHLRGPHHDGAEHHAADHDRPGRGADAAAGRPPQATAQALLDRLGLGYRLELRESDQPPGTVIGTDPEPGEPVPAGEDVTLVIAAAAPATTTVAPTPAVTVTG
jgi:hypothetical protein